MGLTTTALRLASAILVIRSQYREFWFNPNPNPNPVFNLPFKVTYLIKGPMTCYFMHSLI
jgi:hypothetical protein